MDHDTRMVSLARGITNTSRGGPLGATNEKKIRFDLSKKHSRRQQNVEWFAHLLIQPTEKDGNG